jgi:carbamoyl-phosphate synthase large subunit
MKRIMILGAGEMQVPVIKKAKAQGLYTIVADYNPKAPGFQYADEALKISTIDFKEILKAAKNYNINGILTTSDYPVNMVAKVSHELHLPSMSIEVANICTNKYLQRCFFKANNIPSPFFKLISTKEDLNYIETFPLIIKPVDSSASRGVKKVKNRTELLAQYDITKAFSNSGSVLVEEFISGKEYSVETFSQYGKHHIIAITDKRLVQGNDTFFVENTHILPAFLSEKDEALISSIVLNLLTKLNVDNCPCHIEIKLNERGAFIIEIACRLGGDFISSNLVPLAIGVDMLESLINISLGHEISLNKKQHSVAAIQFINNSNYANCIDFVKNYASYISESRIEKFHDRKIENSFDRMGYIILKANNHDIMFELLEKLN